MAIIPKYVATPFTKNGNPALGLAPEIKIFNLENNSLVISGVCLEVPNSEGVYKYKFLTYDSNISYTFVIDGGTILPPGERFSYGGNDSFVSEIALAIQEGIAVVDFD